MLKSFSSTTCSPAAPLQHQTISEWTRERVKFAMGKAFGDDYVHMDAMITPATKVAFGDFQCNVALSIAKPLLSSPRDVALKIVDSLEISDIFETPTIAGPGFINLKLRDDFVFNQLGSMLQDTERIGVPMAPQSQRVVIDFSSPNIAKEMHVGHLRSTIIGDVLSRVLSFRGHSVLRLNHVGDWGTQFGMLITNLRDEQLSEEVELGELAQLYKNAKVRFDNDTDFKQRSREAVVALQSGDEEHLSSWRLLCEKSRKEFNVIYDLLDINIEERGESFYNPMLDSVVSDLEAKGLVEESEGAQVVFLDGFTARDGTSRQPLIIRKSDGGFNYATTDLAAVKQRSSLTGERGDRLLYVVDMGQSDHFEQVFQVARRGGLVREETQVEHVRFGVVLGEDGRKLKTRSGDTVKLKDLLEESIKRAREDILVRGTKERDQSDQLSVDQVAKIVGIGAVKYADLSMSRESNYRFSYSKMLALNGNTAPYMLYAYARIQGISRKLPQSDSLSGFSAPLEHPAEQALAKQLLKFPDVVLRLEKDLFPHILCDYLFELGQAFNQFYETCSVTQAPSPEIQASRGALCKLSANTLKVSLQLLGIGVVDVL